jgi:hypothetical protein
MSRAMRIAVCTCLEIAGCGPEPEATAPLTSATPTSTATTPSTTASPSASASAAAAGCETMAAAITSAEARLAKPTYSCTSDADCACYGGPVCPNSIASACPKVIGVGAQRELAELEDAWRKAGCGGYAWSPSMCEPACRAGVCTASKRRELTDAEQADRCGYKGNLICCLGPPGIKPPPKPLCYSASD